MDLTATTVFSLLVLGTALANKAGGGTNVTCDFSDLEIEDMVHATLNQLPQDYTSIHPKPAEIVPGLFFGRIVFTNLGNLRPYGAMLPFCRNGSRLVQVDLATEHRDVVATLPWKYCAGKKGSIGSSAGGRVTAIFKVTGRSAEGEAKLVLHGVPKAVSVQIGHLVLQGAGDMLGSAFISLRLLFPDLLRTFWEESLTKTFQHALLGITESH